MFNCQILSNYFFQQIISVTFRILSCFTFHMQVTLDTMAQASTAQQRQEVERALREADQGAHYIFNQICHTFFLFFQKLI